MHFFNAALTQIDTAETRRYAGLRNSEFPPQLVTKACQEAQILCTAKAIWQDYSYNAQTCQLETPSGNIQLAGQSITRHLSNSVRVIAESVTVGEAVENAVDEHFKQGDYAHSLLLDAAATTAVEMAADAMENAIRPDFAKQGLALIQRFSPGYGDFYIQFQPQMLKLSMAEKIGISLTESYMLSPRKSITALIGLIPADRSVCRTIEHNCQICQQADCLSRKEPFIK